MTYIFLMKKKNRCLLFCRISGIQQNHWPNIRQNHVPVERYNYLVFDEVLDGKTDVGVEPVEVGLDGFGQVAVVALNIVHRYLHKSTLQSKYYKKFKKS